MLTYLTSSVLYGEQTFDTACREIASAGIRLIDIWGLPGWCDHLNLKNPKVDLAAVQSTLRKHGLDCHAISAYGNPVELVMERLETLKALGGYALVRGSAGPDVSVKSFADSLLPLVKRAEALGVTLAIENHGQAAIDSIDSMVELCRLVPSPGLGIALAPIHLYRRNERTEDAVQALRGRIAFFYAWDWGPSADKNWKDPAEQFPGTGKVDLRTAIRALKQVQYPRPLGIFAHGPEHRPVEWTSRALKQAIAYCHQLDRETEGEVRACGSKK
ncbi:MAG: sugar phosphate isomerase/epimerase [Planctomycetes bacterium]|nr:sugar phosphate isomerase/epimerase [Planctomycetota bacterium]